MNKRQNKKMMKKICGIYKIEHIDTGKAYVGLSTDIFKRWKEHGNFFEEKDKWSVIKKALHKHSLENFNFTILEECSKEALNDREIYWIKELNTQAPNGYNMTPGGRGNKSLGENKKTKVVLNDITYDSIQDASDKNNISYQNLLSYFTRECRWPYGLYGFYLNKKNPDSKDYITKKIVVLNGITYKSSAEAMREQNWPFTKQHFNMCLKERNSWPSGYIGYYK